MKRSTFSHYAEDAERLDRLCKRFGNSGSEIFRMGLKSLEGNQQLYRHALVQPLTAIQTAAYLMPPGETRDMFLRNVRPIQAISPRRTRRTGERSWGAG